MRDFFRHFRFVLHKNWGTLLMFETAYRTAVYMLILELVRRAVSYSLHLGGYSSLNAENFVPFLQKPWTIVIFLLVGLLLLSLTTIEIAALLVCFQYSSENRKIYINDLFFVGIRQSVRLWRRHPLLWMAVLTLTIPFLELQFLVREVSYVKLLRYTAQILYKLAPHPAFLIAGLLGLLFLSYLVSFALPSLLLEEKTIWQSLRRGFALQRRAPVKHLLCGVLVQGAVLLISVVFYVGTMAGMVLLAMQSDTMAGVISSLLVYSGWVNLGIGLVSGALNTVFGTALFFTVFRLRRKRLLAGKLGIVPEIRLPMLQKIGRRRLIAIFLTMIFVGEMSYVGYLAGESREISSEVLVGTQITAHRGGAKYAPENTMAALAYAAEQNADYAEIDVQQTNDDFLVLLHDDSLKRTTGKKKNIWSMNYYRVRALDAGKRFGKEFAGERVPTLWQALQFCKNRMNLIVEIKYNGHNDDIVPKVVAAVKKAGMEDKVIICSMYYRFLEQVKEQCPKITTSYVMPVAYGEMQDLKAADCLSVKHSYVTREFVAQAHRAGKTVHAWTINSQWMMEQMQRFGVDNIITDVPASARQVLNGEWTYSVDFWSLLKYVL